MVSDRLGGPLPFVFTQGAQRLELTPPHLFQVNDTNGLVAGAIAGLGIMQAPGFAAQAAIASGQLIPLLEDWPSDVHSMSVIYPPNRYLSAKVRVFVDWIVEMFARNPGLNRR
jgi:DNA-binding transcriptional LysR family regulator